MFRFLPAEWHDRLPSTNTYLVERVRQRPDTPAGTVVAAREQTAGRGRQQRPWMTRRDQNLTFSFLWRTPVAPEHLPAMAQAISLGMAQFLGEAGLSPTIKWPNDVLAGGKKIGGILCECIDIGKPGPTAIVAGVGLNVNMSAIEAAAIDQPATSLALETGHPWAIGDVLERLLGALVEPLDSWSARGFAGIRDGYTRFAPKPGAGMRVRDGEKHVEGHFAGFNGHGALLLSLENGEERTVYSGDLTAW